MGQKDHPLPAPAPILDSEVLLQEDTTCLMLSRLSPKVTVSKLLSTLAEAAPCQYDFVYLPQDRRKHRNVGLAFVNFQEPAAAASACKFFRLKSSEPGIWANSVVGRASNQGLPCNLAYFLSRSGLEAVDNEHAPLVFQNGIRQNLREAVDKHVTLSMVLEAGQSVKVEQVSRCPGVAGATTTKSISTVPRSSTDSSTCSGSSSNRAPRAFTDFADQSTSSPSSGAKQCDVAPVQPKVMTWAGPETEVTSGTLAGSVPGAFQDFKVLKTGYILSEEELLLQLIRRRETIIFHV
eukprot:CAMPEP_0181470542 /NCGR_PEP_ID=MMETSP1110-20121109/38606_1 /TAXON_ID=174948 /ORGANISM="Symbiodinium sp., Strain CCMP421" /LENGTH=292 /DNA_ID=CAMNT_0023595519 /DNA_START=101 /DNA_END=979 /DNA_ORIENTATION=+